MRKHFLILMLLALLPFTAWAASPDITIGEYGVFFSEPNGWHVVKATPAASTTLPEFSLEKSGTSIASLALTNELSYQTVGNKVPGISNTGVYFRKATFTDGTAKEIYVPFFVSEKYDVDNVNNQATFAASLESGFLKKYYEKYPFCDVEWIYEGTHPVKNLYPGEFPTSTPGTTTGDQIQDIWGANFDQAVAWANTIFSSAWVPTYNIAHTYAAFSSVESNANAFGFIFPNLEGNYYVTITNGTASHSWNDNNGNPMVLTAGKFSYTGQQELQDSWGVDVADPTAIKYFVYPTSIDALPEADVTDASTSTSVDIHTVPVTINISSDALSYKDAQNEPTIENVTVNGVTYYETEWPQLFTLQYYKKIGNEYIAQNADQVQNAGTYAVALVSKGATDADRMISYMNGKESDKKEFAISKVDLQVTLDNATKEYGDADPTELTVIPGALPAGCTSIPTFTFNSLPRVTGAEDVAAVYNYLFTLNDGTQTDITTQNYNVVITNQPTLTITKKAVALTYKNTADIQPEKVYGIETVNEAFANGIKNPENYALADGSSLVDSDVLTTELAGIATGNKVSYSYKYVDKESANWNTKTNAAIDGAAAHKAGITFDDNASDKYLFTIADVDLKVKQANLATAANFTYSKKETAALTYNAAVQNVTKKVVYVPNSSDHTKDVVLYDDEATSFTPQVTISYKYKATATADEDVADNKTAGIYVAYVAPVENGNFYLEGTDPIAASDLDFTINKANLYVYVTEETISKQYTGANIPLPTSTGITFQGLQGNDNADYATAIAAVVAKNGSSTTVKNVNDYNIEPSIPTNSALKTNYNVVTYKTKFNVTPKPITLTPNGMNNVPYDQVHAGSVAATTSNVTASVNPGDLVEIVGTDLTTVLTAYNYVVAQNTYAANGSYPGAISLAKKNDSQITEPAKTMLKNFKITATAKADITIAAGDFTIIVKDKPATYGDQLTWNSFSYLTSGLTNPAITVKYILQDKKTKTIYSQNA